MKTKLSKSEYTTIERVLIGYVNTIKDQEGIDVRARGRERPHQDLLKIFCHHAHKNLGLASSRVAAFVNRDHASVLHACKSFEHLRLTDDDFRAKANFYIDRFHTIDGLEHRQSNYNRIMKLVKAASESKRAEWLEMLRATPEVSEEVEQNLNTVENE